MLALATLVVFWRVLVLGESFADRDLAHYYHPAKALVAPLARASEGIPLWNPFFASGQPFAANPEHAVFFPLTTLFFVLPFELAFRLQVILPVLASALGMYALLRTLRRTRPASLAGALAWSFGGYLLSTTNLLPILFAVCLLPPVLTFVVRLVRRPLLLDVAGLALCFGVECLSGEPSTLLATIPLCAAAALANNPRPSRRAWLAITGGLALGAALGAAALLPGLHHASKTDRADGLGLDEAGEWSMPPVRVLDLVSPHVLGEVVPGDETRYWGRHLYGRRNSPYFFTLYPGLAMSLLGLMSWTTRRRRMWPWMAVGVLGTLVALGTHFPLWPLLRHLPGLASLRFPEKFSLLLILPLTVAAAYGFDQAMMGPARARRFIVRGLLTAAGCGVVAAAVVRWLAHRLAPDFPWRAAASVGLRLTLVALASLAVLWLTRRMARARRALALCAVLTLDLAAVGTTVVHSVPLSVLTDPPPAFVPLVNSKRDELLFHAAEWDTELGNVSGIAKPPLPAQWGLAMTLESDFDRTFLRTTNRGHGLFWEASRQDPRLYTPLLQRRGVTAIVRFRPGSRWQGSNVVGPDGKGAIEPLIAKGTRPVLFPVSGVEIVRGDQGWLQAVVRLGAAAHDTACVDAAHLAAFDGPPSPAELAVRSRTPNRIVAEVVARGPRPSFVAFNQTWDEGWHMLLDGRSSRLLLTDVSLSGFVVPPGKHTVEIFYSDAWVKSGVAISVAAILACLALALLGRRRVRAAAVDMIAAGTGAAGQRV